MATVLPDLPYGSQVNVRPIMAGGMLLPIFGAGPRQKMLRTGDRVSIEVQLPPEDEELAGAHYGARMDAEASGDTVVLAWPQPDFNLPIGTPLVNGAAQLGTSLVCDGGTPRLYLPAKTWFSFVGPDQSGLSTRNYLHMTTQPVVVAADATFTLPVWPPLRASPADNAALEFVRPLIEGFIETSPDYGLEYLFVYTMASFVLAENE